MHAHTLAAPLSASETSINAQSKIYSSEKPKPFQGRQLGYRACVLTKQSLQASARATTTCSLISLWYLTHHMKDKPFSHMHCKRKMIWTLPGGAVCENTNVRISWTTRRYLPCQLHSTNYCANLWLSPKRESSQQKNGHVDGINAAHAEPEKKNQTSGWRRRKWRDEIEELLLVRADADIVRQIQGTTRDLVVYDQIMKAWCNPHHVLSAARSTQRQARSKPNQTFFPVSENVSDTDNLLLSPTRVKGKTPDYFRTRFLRHCLEFIK